MSTHNWNDADGNKIALEDPLSPGRKTAALSRPVVVSNEDKAVLDAIVAALGLPADAAGVASAIGQLKTIATAAADTTTDSPVGVHTPSNVISLTPAIDTAIYAAGDVLFPITALAGVVRANDLQAVLMSLAVIDKADQKPNFRLLFFNAAVASLGAANAVPAISDADALSYMGHLDIAAADYVDLGGVSVACQKAINLLLKSISGSTNINVAGILLSGTPTFGAATDLVLRFGVLQS